LFRHNIQTNLFGEGYIYIKHHFLIKLIITDFKMFFVVFINSF